VPYPTKRSQSVEAEIIERVSKGELLSAVLRSDPVRFPTAVGWNEWCALDEDLARAYDAARLACFDAIADDCFTIADDTSNDTILTDTGPRANNEWLSRSKLRIDTRLRLLAKWNPERYGDLLTMRGDKNNPIVVQTDTSQLVSELMNVLQAIVQPQPAALIEGKVISEDSEP